VGAQGTYVALGDSYTSAPRVGTPTGPAGCARTEADYPHLVAAQLGLSLTDVSCGGATTADAAGSQTTTSGAVAPQLSAVGPTTDVVSVQLGGDDLGFTGVVASCLALSPWGPTASGRTCRSHYDPDGQDQLGLLAQQAGTRLDGVLADVAARAPRARLVVVGYPDILPVSGAGCWPKMPFTTVDAGYLNSVEVTLNGALATAARRHGAAFVDTYTPGEAHTACAAASARWIEPLVPRAPAAPVHPNAAGEAAMARLVAGAMTGGTAQAAARHRGARVALGVPRRRG
jgi:lysophospholipase L1-like esterase